MLRRRQTRLIYQKWVRIADDPSVLYPDNSIGIAFRQLRVVGHHDYKTVFRNLFQKIHDLNTGFRIQSAGGLIRQQNIRVIDQRSCNSHTLHLTAGHLVGALVQLVSQSHVLKRADRPLFPLCPGDARDGQRQFHIGQNRLVRYQIVALKYKSNGVIAVGIPIPIRILFCGNSIDDQIAAVIAVQPADHVQKRSLTGTAGAKDRNKFIFPQIQAHTVQRGLNQIACHIFFSHIFDLKHFHPLSGVCIWKYS